MENLYWIVIKQPEKSKLMKTDNTLTIPERWQNSDKQIQETRRAFEFETIVRKIKILYLGAIKRLEKRQFN